MSEPSEIKLDPAYIDRVEGSGGPLAAAFDRGKGEPSVSEPSEPSELYIGHARCPAPIPRYEFPQAAPVTNDWVYPTPEPTPEPTERTAWLHGWTWWPGHVEINMGTSWYCVGCGKFFGTGCVAFEEGWEPPGPEPDWPFPEEGCPLCALRGKDSDLHDKVSRYEALLYAHGIPLSTMPSQPLSKAQREAIRRNLP